VTWEPGGPWGGEVKLHTQNHKIANHFCDAVSRVFELAGEGQ